MGAMECRRAGCENIMYNHLLMGYYYICDECFYELARLKDKWVEEGVKGAEVEGKVREFLDSPRGRIIADNLTVDEAFKKLLG